MQNPRKTVGVKKHMVYEIPPWGGGGKPYSASGLYIGNPKQSNATICSCICFACLRMRHLVLVKGLITQCTNVSQESQT